MPDEDFEGQSWSWVDRLFVVVWFTLGTLARVPLVARIEGVLDHDQSVVGLMALDIAEGRRFPLFFDGQRYMGAVEAYIAAGFVRWIGHDPRTVALAPLLAFGLFVAGQYAVWRRWKGRSTGHLAAMLSAVGSPMLALWGIVPRGGYVEFLAWALPTLAVYRRVARSGCPERSRLAQAGWGFLLGLGYLLNPLSLTVYVALAIDWALFRHGAELRTDRLVTTRWLDSRAAAFIGFALAAGWLLALAFCCHVDPLQAANGLPYVAFGGFANGPWALPCGALGVVLLLGLAGWWSQGPARLYARLIERPWTLAGLIAALAPFVANGVLARLGRIPAAPSLPIWIAAPWRSGPNLRTLGRAAGPLLGCDPRVAETVLIGQGVDPPPLLWGHCATVLHWSSPVVVAIVCLLIAVAGFRERTDFRRILALKGNDVAPPVVLCLLYLFVALGMFLLQGTSPNGSSVRYLLPLWVVLPGLLASGLGSLRSRLGVLACLGLVVPWTVCQISLWHDLDRPAAARPLAAELTRRGVTAIVAPTPVALIVANLSHGTVGAMEFQPIWPRLSDRYASRFSSERPLSCVVDRRFPWAIRGEGGWAPGQDLGAHLRALAARHPGRVTRRWEVGPFEVWEVRLPLEVVLDRGSGPEHLVSGP